MGARSTIEFALTSVLKKAIDDGAAFDIALLPRPEIDELARTGKIAAAALGRRRPVRPSDIAVRAGTPKPDIAHGRRRSTARCMQAPRRSRYSDGPSGAYIADLLVSAGPRRGDESQDQVDQPRRWPSSSREGEAEIGMQQIVDILPVKRRRIVGPLPAELQNIIVYAAGIAPGACTSECGRMP